MKATNLSWDQIKQLAEMAINNGNDFSLNLYNDASMSVDITVNTQSFKPDITVTPWISTKEDCTYV